MVPITSRDKNLHWNKRLKAVGAFVPIEHVEEAKYEISELLLPEDESMPVSTHDLYLYRFVFVPPEEMLGEDPEPLIAYQSFVNCHRAHTENLKAKLGLHIKVNLDEKLGNALDANLTLRRMILAITVKDKSNPLFGTPLFHSVDFVPDTDKLWLSPQEKPTESGAAVVFTFYKPVEKEARQMVVGLGRYIARMYGSETAKLAFTRAHWRATKGWRYRVSTGTFDRPDSKNLLTTMAYNNNLSAVRRLQNMIMKENEAQQEVEQPSRTTVTARNNTNQSAGETSDRYTDVAELLESTSNREDGSSKAGSQSSTSSHSLTAAVLQQENEMMYRIKQQHQQAQKLVYNNSTVQQVAVQNDTNSVISDLTDESINSADTDSQPSLSSVQSATTMEQSKGQGKAKINFNFNILNKIITPSMSFQQAKATAEAYFSHKLNHETSNKDRILHHFLDQKFLEYKAMIEANEEGMKTDEEGGKVLDQQLDQASNNSDLSPSVESFESQLCHEQKIDTIPSIPVTQEGDAESSNITHPNIHMDNKLPVEGIVSSQNTDKSE